MALTKVPSNLDAAVAITQSASDNSTNVATTAYVDTAIANLVDGAPAALNTLDEIAAALNDDAALNTTLTTSIATKLPLAGGTMTGTLAMGSNAITSTGTISSGAITSSSAISATEYDLPSGGQLDWEGGDARIVEGLVNNYSLSLQTYDGSNLTTALRLDGDNTATFTGQILADSGTANDAYSATGFNSESQIKINVASTQNNYAGIQFSHSGNTEGFIGLVRTSTTVADSDFVIQGYCSNDSAYKEYLRISDQGDLGLGTITPTHSANYRTLDIRGSDGGQILAGRGSYMDFFMYTDSTAANIGALNDIHFEAGSSGGQTPKMIIKSDGKVGIGTINPGENLHVEGSMMLDAYNVGAEEGLFFREGFSSSNKYNLGIMTYAHNGSSIDGMTIGAYNGFSVCTGSNTRNERLRISNTGQFFINSNDGGSGKVTAATTWAGAKFIVRETNGFIDMQSSGDSQTVGYRLGYRENTELAGYIKYGTGYAQMFIDNNYTGSSSQNEYSTMYFRNKNSSNQLKKRMRIGGANGYISTNAIGDAAQASHHFEVQGGAQGSMFLTHNLPGYSANAYPAVGCSSNDLHFVAGSTYTGYISYNGGFTDVSDEREKENITTITNATSKLKQLRGVTHTWKDNRDNGTIHLGLIAQEVQTVVPEVVTEGPLKIDETEPTLGVSYQKLVPLLIETIKELEARITELEG